MSQSCSLLLGGLLASDSDSRTGVVSGIRSRDCSVFVGGLQSTIATSVESNLRDSGAGIEDIG